MRANENMELMVYKQIILGDLLKCLIVLNYTSFVQNVDLALNFVLISDTCLHFCDHNFFLKLCTVRCLTTVT